MKRRAMRLVALMMAMTMLMLTACGDSGEESSNDGSQASTGEKVYRDYFADTPKTLNPHTTDTEYELLMDVSATLYREVYDAESGLPKYIPVIADGEPVCLDEETHKTWEIKIKEGYTFVDDTPLDANAYNYTAMMLNNPKLANRNVDASNYENGAAYLAGECEWEDVGFKVIDDYTFQITFADDYEPENALDVMELYGWVGSAFVHPEMYESCLNEDGTECSYGTTLDKFVASGCYEPTDLIQGQYFEITKRTEGQVPLADIFTPDKVELYAVADSNTAIQMFENGELDRVMANAESYDEYPNPYIYYEPSNMGIYLNAESPVSCEALKDVNFRYALYWGLDRESVVGTVFPLSEPTAYQYLPNSTMPDPEDPVGSKVVYRETEEAKAIRIDGHEVTPTGYDPELAKQYFDVAYANNGNQKITFTMIYSDSSEITKTWAEALQDAWQNEFGTDKLEIKLQATASAIYYDEIARSNMNYDVACSGGWWTNMEEPWDNTNWVSSGPDTYNTQYCVIADDAAAAEWDELYYKSALYENKWDAQAKLESAARMEEILLNDCSFIPAYARGNRYFFSSRVTPVTDVSDPDLVFYPRQVIFNEE